MKGWEEVESNEEGERRRGRCGEETEAESRWGGREKQEGG